jgi:hypothetical protein
MPLHGITKHFTQKQKIKQGKSSAEKAEKRHSPRGGVPNRPAGLQKEPAGIRLGRREKIIKDYG